MVFGWFHSLKAQLKQQLASALAMALQICTTNNNNLISNEQIHAINNHATPKQVMTYKHSLLVYKILMYAAFS